MWKALRVGFMLAFQHFHICFPIVLLVSFCSHYAEVRENPEIEFLGAFQL